ncbi:MAG: asparagine synthetase B [Bacteroidales bacterium]|nr:asparagine synthetase B [Bacteroidales bacterium]
MKLNKAYRFLFTLILMVGTLSSNAAYILIPMDETQKDHLKAYGVSYWVLEQDVEMSWLLNYRGGSFMCRHHEMIENECVIRGVSYQVIADVQAAGIIQEISQAEVNMDEIKLHIPPKIAVYSPKNKQPWDDAVTLVLTYAEIPYDVIYDHEVINGMLPLYDWLHLHHEDFTGQYGKFWSRYKDFEWYRENQRAAEATARELGFDKVSQCKLAVAKKIREYVAGGGYLFAMCSATDSYDVALAADGVDICDVMYDGDPMDPDAQERLDYSQCFAFTDFTLKTSPHEYEISSIDATQKHVRSVREQNDFFTLFDFSAKWDPVPTMLCQNHETVIRGFMGQTTGYIKDYIKPEVLIMGENKALDEARYIHGEFGKGTWTFYSGHDPEDYQHLVGDPPTELKLHPNSTGYRLILNNVLFPAAKKKKQKT